MPTFTGRSRYYLRKSPNQEPSVVWIFGKWKLADATYRLSGEDRAGTFVPGSLREVYITAMGWGTGSMTAGGRRG